MQGNTCFIHALYMNSWNSQDFGFFVHFQLKTFKGHWHWNLTVSYIFLYFFNTDVITHWEIENWRKEMLNLLLFKSSMQSYFRSVTYKLSKLLAFISKWELNHSCSYLTSTTSSIPIKVLYFLYANIFTQTAGILNTAQMRTESLLVYNICVKIYNNTS